MNCTKCGKEIPEGENKVCDECQAKVLEEIASEEKNNTEELAMKEITNIFKTYKIAFNDIHCAKPDEISEVMVV